MILKIKNKIKVGGHILDVVLDGDDLEDRGLNGSLNTRKGMMSINSTRPKSQQIEAWFHEIIHSVNNVFINGERLTEEQVSGISEGLFQVFVDMGVDFDLTSLGQV